MKRSKKSVIKYLGASSIRIVEKENGVQNIIIDHPRNGILVIHPDEERNEPDAEKGFEGFPLSMFRPIGHPNYL